MLCRALTAAFVVSCMCPHTQASQRKALRKDLVCALWLSGLQKEDLDVSMLTKLQRHDVNIDNMNNEDLRNECIYSEPEKHHTKFKIENKTDNSVATPNAYEVSEPPPLNSVRSSTYTTNFTNILETIIDGKSTNHLTPYIFKQNINDKQYYNFLMALQESKAHIQVTLPTFMNTENDPPINSTDMNVIPLNFEHFQNFWRKIITHKDKSTKLMQNTTPVYNFEPEHITFQKTEQYNTGIIGNHMDGKTQNISIILNKRANMNDVNYISNLAKMYAVFLNNQNGYHINEKDKIILDKLEDKQTINDNRYFNHDKSQPATIMRDNNINYEGLNSKNNLLNDISGIILFNDQNKSKQLINPNIVVQFPYNINFTRETSAPAYEDTSTRTSSTQQSTQSRYANELTVLPKFVIDHIAESVKTRILKELQQEIKSTTIAPLLNITTTTKSSINITSKTVTKVINSTMDLNSNKSSETNEVLKTLQELLKEFQILKEKSIPKKIDEPLKHVDNQLSRQPSMHRTIKSHEKSTENNYKVADKIKHEPHKYNYIPNQRIFPAPVVKLQEASIRQTNSREVPPLAIPLLNPSFHYNMYESSTEFTGVHTKVYKPWISHDIHTNNNKETKLRHKYNTNINTDSKYYKHQSNSFERIEEPVIKQLVENTYGKYKDLKPRTYSFGAMRDRAYYYPTTYRPQYSSKSIYPEQRKSDNRDNSKRYNDNISVAIFQNPKKERFHERLERDDDDKIKDSNCCEDRLGLTTRQQTALNNGKSKFDETHFENFLKTQQKVNAMLERIIAATNLHTRVKSVEIA